MILAFIIIGPTRPNGSKICVVRDKIVRFVIFFEMFCNFISYFKVSVVEFQYNPRVFVFSLLFNGTFGSHISDLLTGNTFGSFD
jgi:hypothetical protein